MEHFGVEPDLMTIAKSIAAGLPLSGVIGRAAIMNAPGDSAVGGTYVGNPVAIAAAHAVLDAIADVRGLGAMLAIAIERDGKPDADLATAVAEGAARRGLLLLKAGINSN